MVALEARVIDSHVAGDHTIFVATPVGVRVGANDRPLTSLDLDYVYIGGKSVVARDRDGMGLRKAGTAARPTQERPATERLSGAGRHARLPML